MQTQDSVIGFDLDGVILDHTELKIFLAKKQGHTLTAAETHADAMDLALPPEITTLVKRALYHDPELVARSMVSNGARETFQKLRNANRQYFLISRRLDPELAKTTLIYHKLWPQYFNENNAFFVTKDTEKHIVARKLGIGLYIDDSQKVLELLPTVTTRLWFNPWAASNAKHKPFSIVHDWDEINTFL